jgi:enoyl-CoA hydratase/carnithine racemase
MAKQAGKIILHAEDGWARLVISNPARRNAISRAMWQELRDHARTLAGNDTVRVVVLEGEGDKAFAAGADISEFSATRTPDSVQAFDDLIEEACRAFEMMTIPVVAIIRGACYGSGVSLALSCDLRYCEPDARFAIPAVKLGLSYPPASIARLVRCVGSTASFDMLLTGDSVNAQIARRMGLVTRIVDADLLANFTAEIVEGLRANAPLSLAAAKVAVAGMTDGSLVHDAETLTEMTRACSYSEDYQEGQRAFIEKRRPLFKGR